MGNSVFTVKLHSTSAEQIHAITLGGNQSTTVCPPSMLQEQPGSTSPHHLFLASIGSCVNLVFEIAMRKAHLELLGVDSEINGHYETDEESGMSRFNTIEIITKAIVPKGVKEERLQKLFDMAHSSCPIGNCLIGSCVKVVTNLEVIYK